MSVVIAVDGPGSSGKGTVARLVAQRLGLQYVDTGAMYRSVAMVAQERGVDLHDGTAVAVVAAGLQFAFRWDGNALAVLVDGRDVTAALRADAVGRRASTVAAHPAVRAALLDRQRVLAQDGGLVMDGRDIGTVVLPDADVKVFLDAAIDVRARRRHEELAARGEDAPLQDIHDALSRRDARDSERVDAPLRQADDAVLLDTTNLTIDQAVDAVVALVAAIDTATSIR